MHGKDGVAFGNNRTREKRPSERLFHYPKKGEIGQEGEEGISTPKRPKLRGEMEARRKKTLLGETGQIVLGSSY